MGAGDTVITIAGNMGRDPELRFTPTGQAVCTFSVGSTPRFMDRQTNEWKDGDTLWLNVVVWRQMAENCAESLQRGMRVVVQGRLKQRSYETKEGEKRTVYEVDADEVGPSLRNASAKVTKTTRGRADSNGGGAAPAEDPWASEATAAAARQSGHVPGTASDGSSWEEPPF